MERSNSLQEQVSPDWSLMTTRTGGPVTWMIIVFDVNQHGWLLRNTRIDRREREREKACVYMYVRIHKLRVIRDKKCFHLLWHVRTLANMGISRCSSCLCSLRERRGSVSDDPKESRLHNNRQVTTFDICHICSRIIRKFLFRGETRRLTLESPLNVIIASASFRCK